MSCPLRTAAYALALGSKVIQANVIRSSVAFSTEAGELVRHGQAECLGGGRMR